MPSDQITILKTTSERGLRAKPLALQARLSRPPMPLFFVVFYDSNLTSRQVGSVYFIFRLLKLHEKSSQEVPQSKDESSSLEFLARRASQKSINTSLLARQS